METLTLTLPDILSHSLRQQAQRQGQSPDEFVLHLLEHTLTPANDDPLLQMLGTLEADTPDIGKRHDEYLAQAHRGE